MVSTTTAVLALVLGIASQCRAGGPADLVIHSRGGNVTTSIMYGLMHEDINNSGDGGIYAELISNRAFQGSAEFPSSLESWSAVNNATLTLKKLNTPLSAALPNSLNVAAGTGTKKGAKVGFANAGYWGMDVRVQNYTGSFFVRGGFEGAFTASLQSAITGEVFGSVEVPGTQSVKDGWVQRNFTLVPRRAAGSSNNTFAVTFDAAGIREGSSLDFNLISLFPPTYKNRPNGMRIDIMEALAKLNPKFLRLPGGNMLEGNTIDTYWKWNETIGPLKNRPGMAGVWKYQLTTGMGLVEYMHWCDDLNLEPIVAVWAGLSLDGAYTPQSEIHTVVQYALDELEFLTGAATTKWGGVRASILGHDRPWRVKYVEIGNEDWLAGRPTAFDSYKQYRFQAFQSAFANKYPDIQIIASPSVFDNMVIPAPAAGDYHPYLTPDEFVAQFSRFDRLGAGNLTFIGEAATVHANGGKGWDGNLMPNPWWAGSVAEAIFLLGAERNSDRIIGATYAPGLRNLNRWQWGMTLMQHAADPALTTLSTSWYLLGNHVITKTLPVSHSSKAFSIGPLYYVAGTGEKGTSIVKLAVYNATEPVQVSLQFEAGYRHDAKAKGARGTLTVLTGPKDPYAVNDPFTRVNVVNETISKLTADEKGLFKFSLPPLSVAVFETGGEREGGR
ncbi:glycoside hydrolase superfamily [Podospora appendiculata]|uniref:non-reducing end alpha-L-arabinofuranosidase n=1 Tax=Podospora appendiculata TaxID=314037 RepID=A0AAE1CED8_9PEZI|nr:glycoside hydrolase superfamily [Podospora appendiculata]